MITPINDSTSINLNFFLSEVCFSLYEIIKLTLFGLPLVIHSDIQLNTFNIINNLFTCHLDNSFSMVACGVLNELQNCRLDLRQFQSYESANLY